METCQTVLDELDATLEELHGVLQLTIEQGSLAEKKKTEMASRPALKEARRKLSELRAEIRRLNDPTSRMEFEAHYKDRETRLRNYVTAMKEVVFPNSAAGGGGGSSVPQTYAERKAAELMGPGGADGTGFQNAGQVLTAATNMQQDALEAIERAERVQYVTEETGRQTLEQLRIQTERMYQIDEELEDIHGQLDHASKDIKWFFRQLAGDKCLLSLFGIFILGFLVMLFVVIWKRR